MSKSGKTFIILLAFISIVGTYPGILAEILTKPADTEAVVGSLVYFNCSSSLSNESHWKFYRPGGDTEENLVYGYGQFYNQFKGRFRIENVVQTTYNLIIDSVRTDDAGKYECQDNDGRGSKSLAQLIVLESEPSCQSNIDTDKVVGSNDCGIEPSLLILSCTAKFYGIDAPILKWHRVGNANLTGSVTHRITGNVVNYSLSMKGDSIQNNSMYMCSTTRSISTENGCESSVVKITGSISALSFTESPSVWDYTMCTCKVYKDAIICFFLLILPLAVGVSIVLTRFYYLRHRKGMSKVSILSSTSRYDQDLETEPELLAGHEKNQETLEKQNNDYNRIVKELDERKKEIQTLKDKHSEDINELQNTIQSKTNEITQLKSENKELMAEKEKLEFGNKKLLLENEKLTTDYDQLTTETNQLISKVDSFENRLYSQETHDYVGKPKLVGTITTHASAANKEKTKGKTDGPAIKGIAIWKNELFVLNEESPEIEVYDSATFKHVRNYMIENLENPLDVVFSKVGKCLYIINGFKAPEKSSEILRIFPESGDIVKSWLAEGRVGRLSTYQSNVIVCLSDKLVICEYSKDGIMLHLVRLSPGEGFVHPCHAIKVSSKHFMVSHLDVKESQLRMCVVDSNGRVILNTTEKDQKELKAPACLLEDKGRFILAADTENGGIHLLNSALKYQRKLVDDKSLNDCPSRLCFDETETRLFVATNKRVSDGIWKDGRVLIFNVKE